MKSWNPHKAFMFDEKHTFNNVFTFVVYIRNKIPALLVDLKKAKELIRDTDTLESIVKQYEEKWEEIYNTISIKQRACHRKTNHDELRTFFKEELSMYDTLIEEIKKLLKE